MNIYKACQYFLVYILSHLALPFPTRAKGYCVTSLTSSGHWKKRVQGAHLVLRMPCSFIFKVKLIKQQHMMYARLAREQKMSEERSTQRWVIVSLWFRSGVYANGDN